MIHARGKPAIRSKSAMMMAIVNDQNTAPFILSMISKSPNTCPIKSSLDAIPAIGGKIINVIKKTTAPKYRINLEFLLDDIISNFLNIFLISFDKRIGPWNESYLVYIFVYLLYII